MRFIINIESTPVLLTLDQMNDIVKVLENAEKINNKYVGDKKGEDGTNYLRLLEPYCASEALSLRVMSNDLYETKKLVSKLHKDQS